MEGESVDAAPRGPAASRRGDVERRILESAAGLIREGAPWHGLGIRQITDRASLSRTAFYDFFASKQDVLVQLVNASAHELRDALRHPGAGPFGAAGSLAEPEPFLTALAGFNDVHGPIYRAFVQAMAGDEELLALWRALLASNVSLIATVIERERAADLALPREPPSEELAEVLILMTERTMTAMLQRPAPDERRARLQALAHVWRTAVFGTARD